MAKPASLPNSVSEDETSRRSKLRTCVTIAAYSIFAALVIWIFFRDDSQLPGTFKERIPFLAGLALISVALMSLRGILNVLAFSLGFQRQSLWNGFRFAVWNTLSNMLPFSPGIAVKAAMLRKMYHVSLKTFGGISLQILIIAICVRGVAGLVAMALIKEYSLPLIIGFFMMAGAPVIFQLIKVISFYLLQKHVYEFLKQTNLLTSHSLSIGLTHFLIFLLESLRLYWAFQFLGLDISFDQTLLMTSGAFLSTLVFFIPNGMLIRESLIAGIASLSGLGSTDALIAATLDRSGALLGLAACSLIVGLGDSYAGRNHSSNRST